MCGIAGMAGPGAAEVVRAMTGALVHRGPDDGGHYDDPAARLCLGMRRLGILDLAHGHQPMANPDQSVWIVYNGEIFILRICDADLRNAGTGFTRRIPIPKRCCDCTTRSRRACWRS